MGSHQCTGAPPRGESVWGHPSRWGERLVSTGSSYKVGDTSPRLVPKRRFPLMSSEVSFVFLRDSRKGECDPLP